MNQKCIITDNTGWIKILIDGTNIVPAPEFLQIDYEGRKINVPSIIKDGQNVRTINGKTIQITKNNRYYFAQDPQGQERDFFTILEGPYKGKKGSVKTPTTGSWIGSKQTTGAVNLKFIMQEERNKNLYGILQLPSKTVNAFTIADNPVETGRHFLELPGAPHDGGLNYTNMCDRPRTWFRLGNSGGSRFLHPGRGSLGCITVNIEGWNDVYWTLCTARKGDGKNVGMVEVIDKIT